MVEASKNSEYLFCFFFAPKRRKLLEERRLRRAYSNYKRFHQLNYRNELTQSDRYRGLSHYKIVAEDIIGQYRISNGVAWMSCASK